MLLDEADVFLQTRDRADLERNAIVSVFLRTLEYYSGILFLTTNKVGTFDEAFKSRISISLYYRKLDRKQTMEIWDVNLRRLREKKGITFDQKVLVEWAEKNFKATKKHPDLRRWNGRQIHNACQTAAALAKFENKGVLTSAHLDTVAKASQDFDLYLKATHGMDDYGRAAREQDRGDDEYEQTFDHQINSTFARSTPMRAKEKMAVRRPSGGLRAKAPRHSDTDDDSD